MCCGEAPKKIKSNATPAMRITDVPCLCRNCDWRGIVDECEGDADGDGGLGCPRCGKIVTVAEIHDQKD